MVPVGGRVRVGGSVRVAGRARPAGGVGVLAGVAAAAVLLVALAGCTGRGSTESSGAGGGAGSADSAAPGLAAGAASKGTGEPPAQARIAPLSRALIRTAELTVRVDDVRAAAGRVGTVAVDTGGGIYGDSRSGTGDQARADLVVKVETNRMDAALDRIAAFGTEEQRASKTEDVTEQVADVESRVATMKASIARVRAILSRASTIGDVVRAEGELANREAELESLQARQRALDGQVALATVTVHLLARSAAAPAGTDADRGFLAGLRGGWNAFAGTVSWTLTVLGAVLPFLLLAVPVLLAWRYAARRRRAVPAPPAA